MSYVAATKQLLADDLRSLISHFTNFEPTSSSFKKIEDFAWNEIIHKYHPAVDDQEIQMKIEGFAEKFLFHGFFQKAANLKKLVEHYNGLEYFKNAKDGNLKWGLISLIIKLSRKPTDALEDDEPIIVEQLSQGTKHVNESFDWASFLKEGWEKFQLPEDELSFSADELSFSEHRQRALTQNAFVPNQSSSPKNYSVVLSNDGDVEEPLNQLILQEKLANYLEETRKGKWWLNPEFSEVEDPQTSYCRKWELAVRNEGVRIGPIRVFSEDKVVWEIIRLYGSAALNSLFIEHRNGFFEPKPNFSLAVLNSFTFGEILRKEVCRYLPTVRILNDFCERISSRSLSDEIPTVYVAYSFALTEITTEYRKRLVEFENICKEKSEECTLRGLFIHMKPMLRVLKLLASVHSRAVYADYENVENWMCNVRLLGVLFNQLNTFRKRIKLSILRLFVSSLYSYLGIAERFMKSNERPDPKDEFVIFKREDGGSTLDVRPFSQILSSLKVPSAEFFDPFVSVCFRAASSSHFLSQLGKVPTVSKNNEPKGFMGEQFLSNLLIYFQLDGGEQNQATFQMPICQPPPPPPPLPSISPPPFSLKWTSSFFVSHCLQDAGKPPPRSSLSKFCDKMTKIDLLICNLPVVVEQCAVSAVTKNMEPEGFLYEVFQNDFKLLDHLKSLRTVYFAQRLHSFLVLLFNKMLLAQQRNVNWNEKLRDCLSDDVPNDMLKNFFFTLGPSFSSKTSDILQQLSLVKILYKPDSRLKSIITDSAIKIYNELFVFLVQFNWSHKSLYKLRFNMLKENKTNFVRLRRLYSMKMWLIHLMNSFSAYFNSIDEEAFEKSLIKLFGEARDLQTIRDAHHNFLTESRKILFLNKGNPCKVMIQRIFKLCSNLMFFWHLERNHELKDFQLNAMEQEYLAVAKALPVTLQNKRTQLRSASFRRLFEEIRCNVPTDS